MNATKISRLIVALGGALVGTGYMLPWGTVDPRHEGPVIDVKFWRQDTGFESEYLLADALTLLPLVIAVLLMATYPRSRLTRAVTALSGVFYIGLPIRYAATVPMHYTVASGVYLVSIGGVLLLFGAVAGLVRSES
ncbi:hypothetical protein BRD20_09185 [Halobacteriales archaeon SW_8_65_20]|nr:MAG: hypothetical protein BRD20_09185 [Halobacteriales archaeon SW_8_65_20]